MNRSKDQNVRWWIAVLLVALLWQPVIGGRTFFVNPSSGTGTEDGSLNNPYLTISAALASQLQAGDIIQCAPANYYERITIPLGVRVVGSSPFTTILDGNGVGPVVQMAGPLHPAIVGDTGISGFTIRNGSALIGGGMFISQGAPLISRNIITGNSAVENGGYGGYGGGIEVYRSKAIIQNNVIEGNSADVVGGGIDVYLSPNAVISNNAIVNNSTTGNGGGISLTDTGSVKLVNNIVAYNSGGSGIFVNSGSPVLMNQDFWSNTPNNYAGIADPTGSNGNVSMAPNLTADFRLIAGSALIDAGTALNAPPDDLILQARPLDGDSNGSAIHDLGAYELRPFTDSDGDGVDDMFDNCPAVANASQLDSDNDGVGQACDNCVGVPNATQSDSDLDELGDLCDNCISFPNPDQSDLDMDGFGDLCDPDPLDNGVPLSKVPTLGGVGLAAFVVLLIGAMLFVWRRRQGLFISGESL